MAKKPKYTNLVFVQHKGNPKIYLFQAPLDQDIQQGDLLLAETSQGLKDDVHAEAPNIIMASKLARHVARCFGAGWPLARIVGKVERKHETIVLNEVVPFPGCEKIVEKEVREAAEKQDGIDKDGLLAAKDEEILKLQKQVEWYSQYDGFLFAHGLLEEVKDDE